VPFDEEARIDRSTIELYEIQRDLSGTKTERVLLASETPRSFQRLRIQSAARQIVPRSSIGDSESPERGSIRRLLLSEIYYAVYRAGSFMVLPLLPPEYRGWLRRSHRLDGIGAVQEQKVRDETIKRTARGRANVTSSAARKGADLMPSMPLNSPRDRCIGCRLPAH